MRNETILIIEDDPDIVELLQFRLKHDGYDVLVAGDGEAGIEMARKCLPNAILLDLMLPGVDGLEVCRRLKQGESTLGIPIVMVTAKSEEIDVVTGLELGADDYIAKPFSPREVLARIRAVMRRGETKQQASKGNRLSIGDVALDRERHEVTVGGELAEFTLAEFRLLWALVSRPGRVYTRDDLVEKITGGEAVITDRNIDVHISAIRKKLGNQANLIATVRGLGYKCRD